MSIEHSLTIAPPMTYTLSDDATHQPVLTWLDEIFQEESPSGNSWGYEAWWMAGPDTVHRLDVLLDQIVCSTFDSAEEALRNVDDCLELLERQFRRCDSDEFSLLLSLPDGYAWGVGRNIPSGMEGEFLGLVEKVEQLDKALIRAGYVTESILSSSLQATREAIEVCLTEWS